MAKPGAILGEATLRRQLASEAILQGKEIEVIPESENVDAVLASAPVPAVDTYAVDSEPQPKRDRSQTVIKIFISMAIERVIATNLKN